MKLAYYFISILTLIKSYVCEYDCTADHKNLYRSIFKYLLLDQCELNCKQKDIALQNINHIGNCTWDMNLKITRILFENNHINICNPNNLEKSVLCFLQNAECLNLLINLLDNYDKPSYCESFTKTVECIRNEFIDKNVYNQHIHDLIETVFGIIAVSKCENEPCMQKPCLTGNCRNVALNNIQCECDSCSSGATCEEITVRGCEIYDWEECFMDYKDVINDLMQTFNVTKTICQILKILQNCILPSESNCLSFEQKWNFNNFKEIILYLEKTCQDETITMVVLNLYLNFLKEDCVSGYKKCETHIIEAIKYTNNLNNIRLYQYVNNIIEFYDCYTPYINICFESVPNEIKNFLDNIIAKIKPTNKIPCYDTKKCLNIIDSYIFNVTKSSSPIYELIHSNSTRNYHLVELKEIKSKFISTKLCIHQSICHDIYEMGEIYTDIAIRENFLSTYITINICENGLECENGGFCDSNICYCLKGYSGISCKISDACSNYKAIHCLTVIESKLNKVPGIRNLPVFNNDNHFVISQNSTINSCGYNNYLSSCFDKLRENCSNNDIVEILNLKKCTINSYIIKNCNKMCKFNTCQNGGYCIGRNYQEGYKCICKIGINGQNCQFYNITCNLDQINATIQEMFIMIRNLVCKEDDCDDINEMVQDYIEVVNEICKNSSSSILSLLSPSLQLLNNLTTFSHEFCFKDHSCEDYDLMFKSLDFMVIVKASQNAEISLCDQLLNLRLEIYLRKENCTNKKYCIRYSRLFDIFFQKISNYNCILPCQNSYLCYQDGKVCRDLGDHEKCTDPNCELDYLQQCAYDYLIGNVDCRCSVNSFDRSKLDACDENIKVCRNLVQYDLNLLTSIKETSTQCDLNKATKCNSEIIMECFNPFINNFMDNILVSSACSYFVEIQDCFNKVSMYNNKNDYYQIGNNLQKYCKDEPCLINPCHNNKCIVNSNKSILCQCSHCYTGVTCAIQKFDNICSIYRAYYCSLNTINEGLRELNMSLYDNEIILALIDVNFIEKYVSIPYRIKFDNMVKKMIKIFCNYIVKIDECVNQLTKGCLLKKDLLRINGYKIVHASLSLKCLNKNEIFIIIKNILPCYSNINEIIQCISYLISTDFIEFPSLSEMVNSTVEMFYCIKPYISCSSDLELFLNSTISELQEESLNSTTCADTNNCIENLKNSLNASNNLLENTSINSIFAETSQCIDDSECDYINKIEYISTFLNYAYYHDYFIEYPRKCNILNCMTEIISSINSIYRKNCDCSKKDRKKECTTLESIKRCTQKYNECDNENIENIVNFEKIFCTTYYEISYLCEGECINEPCQNEGKCIINQLSEFSCICNSNNFGKLCQYTLPSTCDIEDLNHHLKRFISMYVNSHCLNNCDYDEILAFKNLLLFYGAYSTKDSSFQHLCNFEISKLLNIIISNLTNLIGCKKMYMELCTFKEDIITCFSTINIITKLIHESQNACTPLLEMRKCFMDFTKYCESMYCKYYIQIVDKILINHGCIVPCQNSHCNALEICIDEGDKYTCEIMKCTDDEIVKCLKEIHLYVEKNCKKRFDEIDQFNCKDNENVSNCLKILNICDERNVLSINLIQKLIFTFKQTIYPCQKIKITKYCEISDELTKCIDFDLYTQIIKINTAIGISDYENYCTNYLNTLHCVRANIIENGILSRVNIVNEMIGSLSNENYCQHLNIFKCSPNPCLNSGKCIIEQDHYVCQCLSCYSDVNEKCQLINSNFTDLITHQMEEQSTEEGTDRDVNNDSDFVYKNYAEFTKQCNFEQVSICLYSTIKHFKMDTEWKIFVVSNTINYINNICNIFKEFKFCLQVFTYKCITSNDLMIIKIAEKILNFVQTECIHVAKIAKKIKLLMSCLYSHYNDEIKKDLMNYWITNMDRFLTIKLALPTLPYISQHFENLNEMFLGLIDILPTCFNEILNKEIQLVVDIIKELNPIYQIAWEAKMCIINFDNSVYDENYPNPIFLYLKKNLTPYDVYSIINKTTTCIQDYASVNAFENLENSENGEILQIKRYLLIRQKSILETFDYETLHICYRNNPCINGICIPILDNLIDSTNLTSYTCRCKISENNHDCDNLTNKCNQENVCLNTFYSIMESQPHIICKDTFYLNPEINKYENCIIKQQNYCQEIVKLDNCMKKMNCTIKDDVYCKFIIKANTLCHQYCQTDPCVNGTCIIITNNYFDQNFKCNCKHGYMGEKCDKQVSCDLKQIITDITTYSNLILNNICNVDIIEFYCSNSTFQTIENSINQEKLLCSKDIQKYINITMKHIKIDCSYIPYLYNMDNSVWCMNNEGNTNIQDCFNYNDIFLKLKNPEVTCSVVLKKRKCLFDAIVDCSDPFCIKTMFIFDNIMWEITKCEIPCRINYCETKICLDVGDSYKCQDCNKELIAEKIITYNNMKYQTLCINYSINSTNFKNYCFVETDGINNFISLEKEIDNLKKDCNIKYNALINVVFKKFDCNLLMESIGFEFEQSIDYCYKMINAYECIDIKSVLIKYNSNIQSTDFCNKTLNNRKCLMDSIKLCTKDCTHFQQIIDNIVYKIDNCYLPCQNNDCGDNLCIDNGNDYECIKYNDMCNNENIGNCLNTAFYNINKGTCKHSTLKRKYRESYFNIKQNVQLSLKLEYSENLFNNSCLSETDKVNTCLNVLQMCKKRSYFILKSFRQFITLTCNPDIMVPNSFSVFCSGRDGFTKCFNTIQFATGYSGSIEEYCQFSMLYIRCHEKYEIDNFFRNPMVQKQLNLARVDLALLYGCIDYNPCYYNPCYNGGQCEYTIDKYKNYNFYCKCPKCYYGFYCEILINNSNLIENKLYHNFSKQCNMVQFFICLKKHLNHYIVDFSKLELDFNSNYIFDLICEMSNILKSCQNYFIYNCKTTSILMINDIITHLTHYIQNICNKSNNQIFINIIYCINSDEETYSSLIDTINMNCLKPNLLDLLKIKLGLPTIPYLYNNYKLLYDIHSCVVKYISKCIINSIPGIIEFTSLILSEFEPSKQKCLTGKKCIYDFDNIVYISQYMPIANFLNNTISLEEMYEYFENTDNCIYNSILIDVSCNVAESNELKAFLQARKWAIFKQFDEKNVHICFKKNPCLHGTCIRMGDNYNCDCDLGYSGLKCSVFQGCQKNEYKHCIINIQSMLSIVPFTICSEQYSDDKLDLFDNCIVRNLPDYCSVSQELMNCLGKSYVKELCNTDKTDIICDLFIKANTLCHQHCLQLPCQEGQCINERIDIFEYKFRCICRNKECQTKSSSIKPTIGPIISTTIQPVKKCEIDQVLITINEVYSNYINIKCKSKPEFHQFCTDYEFQQKLDEINSYIQICPSDIIKILENIKERLHLLKFNCSNIFVSTNHDEIEICNRKMLVYKCFNVYEILSIANKDVKIVDLTQYEGRFNEYSKCYNDQLKNECDSNCNEKLNEVVIEIVYDFCENYCIFNCENVCNIDEKCINYKCIKVITFQITLKMEYKQEYSDIENLKTRILIGSIEKSLSLIHKRKIKVTHLRMGSIIVEYFVIYDKSIELESIINTFNVIKSYADKYSSITLKNNSIDILKDVRFKSGQNWYQDLCSIFEATQACKNNSTCEIGLNDRPICMCTNGYQGKYCQDFQTISRLEMIILICTAIVFIIIVVIVIIVMFIKNKRRREESTYTVNA